MPITNKTNKGGYVTFRCTGTETLRLNSNTSVAGANSVGETLTGMTIVDVGWAMGANAATITRGANTVLRLTGEGFISFQESGMGLELPTEESEDLTVTMNNGFVVLKVHKQAPQFTSEY